MKKSKLLAILIPCIAVLLAVVVLVVILLMNRITANNYFEALNESPYSKLVQTTSITEDEIVVYEKIETIIKVNGNIYHKIVEKEISDSVDEMYSTTTNEYYYTSDTMYYLSNGEWKTKKVDEQLLNTYNLEKAYFETITFDKKVKETGTLEGKLLADYVDDAISAQNLNNVALKIIVDKDFNVQEFLVNAKMSSGRDVKIQNVYTYNEESITLPTV